MNSGEQQERRPETDETVEIRHPLTPLPARWETLGELGRGGMGIVYKARDRETGEVLAVKILKPEIAADAQILERFKNELRLAHRITHRNVARLYEFHRADDCVFVSMEFVEGESLRDELKRGGKMTVERGLEIARQLFAGVGEAHRQSIVHRDLKPENIMLTPEGEAKVMDFGISKSYAAGVTATGAIIGTPAYMAPEQAEGKPTDQRTDIYACGLILYEMFTGSQAFSGETPVSVALKQVRELPPAPGKVAPGLPKPIESAIMQCLEKDPARRFQSVEELARALEGDTAAVRATPGRSGRRVGRRAGAIPAIALVAVAAWYLGHYFTTPPAGSLRVPIEQFRLSNGLPVILSLDHGAPVLNLTVSYSAGARRDPPGRGGLALLVAHLMQRGSANVSAQDEKRLVENAGGNYEYGMGAASSYFSTTLPANQLELALFLEADRMRSLEINADGLEATRSLVLEQIADRKNQPYDLALDRLMQLTFANPLNQRRGMGVMEEVKNITLDEAIKFHQTYYVPSNAALALVGDFDAKTAREKIQHYFGDIAAKPAPAPPDVSEAAHNGERRESMTDPSAHVPIVLVSYPVAPISNPDWYALDSLRQLLAVGSAARLRTSLVDGAGVAFSIESELSASAGPNDFWLALVSAPGKDLAQIEQMAFAEIDKIAAQGVSADDLERLRSEALRNRAMSMVSTAARAVQLAQFKLSINDPEAVNEREDYVRKLTGARVQEVAKKYLTAANRTVIEVMPGALHSEGHGDVHGGKP